MTKNLSEITEEEMAMKALLAAKDAFNRYLSDQGVDSAYFDIVFTAFVLTEDFHRWKKVEIEDEYKPGR